MDEKSGIYTSELEVFLDERFPDERMESVYANMDFCQQSPVYRVLRYAGFCLLSGLQVRLREGGKTPFGPDPVAFFAAICYSIQKRARR